MTTSDAKKQITTGAFLSYFTLFLTNISGLLVTPYMLGALGKSQYGLYMLIGSVVGYLGFLDFGISNSIVRYVARYRALNDRAGEQNFLVMALMAYCVIAVLAALVGVVLYANLGALFGHTLSVDEMHSARIMFAILMLNVSISFPSGAIAAIITGYERFTFARGIGIAKFVIRTLLLVVLLYLGFKAVAIVVLDTAVNLALFAVNVLYVIIRLRVRFVLHKWDKVLIYEVVHYSFWMFAALIFSQLYGKIGQIILGMKDGTATVAVFAVGALVASYHGSLGYVFSNLLLPHATKIVARGASRTVLTDLMVRIGRLQFVILSCVLGGFIVLGRQFIALWVGASYQHAWIIATVMMIPSTVAITRDFGVAIQQAQNRNVFRAFYCAFLVLSTASLGLLARHLIAGDIAMAVGDMLTVTIGHLIMTVYYSRVINIQMGRFHREVFLPQLYCMVAPVVVGAAIAHFWPVNHWFMLFFQGAIYFVLFTGLTWRFGLNDNERAWFSGMLNTGAGRLGLRAAVAR
jgi:O-antigen/teichoic acid export membrane protein